LSAKKKTTTEKLASETGILISVVIPVYNVKKYLAETIESVLIQDIERMEVIAINDGSNDGSAVLLDDYAKNESRVKVIHQENRGLSAVRNLGLKLAKGKYIYFLDSDDILLPGTLHKVIDRLEGTDSDIARFSVNLIDEKGNLRKQRDKNKVSGLDVASAVKGETFLHFLFQNELYGAIVQKFVFLRSFLVQNHLQFDEGYIHEDEAFTMESLCMAEKVVSFNEVMLLKRTRSGSIMSTQRNEENVRGWLKAASRLLKFIEKRTFSADTEKIIKTKVSQLILISLKTIRDINHRTKLKLDLFDYINRSDLKKIGFTFSLKVRYNFLYRVYYKLISLLSLK
jgi:glycosyltransferase involved in cell wall biosynthesis